MDCLGKLAKCIERFNKGEIDADTSSKIEKQILVDEFDDPEFLNFAVENIIELFEYIATGRINIRIHRDIEGKMWFWCWVGCELMIKQKNYQITKRII